MFLQVHRVTKYATALSPFFRNDISIQTWTLWSLQLIKTEIATYIWSSLKYYQFYGLFYIVCLLNAL